MTGPPFIAADFARVQPRTRELARRFDWPIVARFRSTHDRFPEAATIRLISGRAVFTQAEETAENTFVVGLSPASGLESVSYYWAEHTPALGSPAGYDLRVVIADAPADKWLQQLDKPFSYSGAGWSLLFTPTAVSAQSGVDGAAWADWTYATTLMTVSQPVYRDDDDRGGPEHQARARLASARLTRIQAAIRSGRTVALAAIKDALATPVSETGIWDDRGWDKIAKWAKNQGAVDAAIGIRARFRPLERCSMDSSPQEATTAYADLCYAAGRLGCFLDLQVQLMDDQFRRGAYPDDGEAAPGTQVVRLRGIGIDVARFLRGLVFSFAMADKTRRELDPWRLARSMKEAGLEEAMTVFLRDSAARADLDAFNRLRAAQTYAYLRYHVASGGTGALDHQALAATIRAELLALDLPEPAAAWARSVGTGE